MTTPTISEIESLLDTSECAADCGATISAIGELIKAVRGILARLKENEDAARHANTIASCLANGIKPD